MISDHEAILFFPLRSVYNLIDLIVFVLFTIYGLQSILRDSDGANIKGAFGGLGEEGLCVCDWKIVWYSGGGGSLLFCEF